MRKLGFFFILFIAFVGKSYAYLPNNPANLHGTLINNSTGLAKWEKEGDSLYYEITITTPFTFFDHSFFYMGTWYETSLIEFWGYEHDEDYPYPGSLKLVFDTSTFPYGTRTYSGVMDITGWSDDWTTIQADYRFYDSESNEIWVSEFFTPEGVWD